MEKLKHVSIFVAKAAAVLVLTAGNGWAVASYAKKYGMVCKSCHTFGSELNSLGLKFKKNGHSFGEESASQKVKTHQVESQKDKIPEAAGKSSSKQGSPAQGGMDDSPEVDEPLETEQELPETIVYSCLSSDGTPHYSDNPCDNFQVEIQAFPEKVSKKSSRAGTRPIPVKNPKRLQRETGKAAASVAEETVLSKDELSEPPEASIIEKTAAAQPKSYEECMEKIFLSYPAPQSPDAAMEQFREAKNSCVRYEKKPKR